MAHESWKSLDLCFEKEPLKDCYFKVLDTIGEMIFSELLEEVKIGRLSDFLSNYTISP